MNQKFKQKFIFIWLGVLFVAAVLVWLAVFAKAQSGLLEVDFFDVGQGKAIFIEAPDGNQILIDGGPDNSILEKLSSKMPYFDRSIDLVILTHPDADHLNGLIEVAKRYQIGRVIETGIRDKTAGNQAWEALIKENNIPVTFALAGERIKIGDGFLLEILYPNQSLAGQDISNTNSSSIVSRLLYGKNSILFTGDEEESIESYLLASGAHIGSDILDVAHHGSKHATSQEFLQAVTPKIAVIQVGAHNSYGHPAQETLQRLEAAGAKIYRTDLCGDIDIFSDGQNLQFRSACE